MARFLKGGRFIPKDLGGEGVEKVTNFADLPVTGSIGDVIYVINDQAFYSWNGSAWIPTNSTTGAFAINGFNDPAQTIEIANETTITEPDIQDLDEATQDRHIIRYPMASDNASVTAGLITYADWKKLNDLDSPLQLKGSISVASDFPTSVDVETGWSYIISADVTDDDASKTNTGQSFEQGQEIVWNSANWTELGNRDAKSVNYTNTVSGLLATQVQNAIDEIQTDNPGISFKTDLASNPTYSEGLLFYDKDKKALSYYTEESDVTENIGREFLIRVLNDSGADIPNGKVVYPNGFDNTTGLPTIDLADAKEKDKCKLVGMTTHSIENGTIGYVTRLGEVSDIDTTGLTGIVYLKSDGSGDVTNIRPDDGSFEVIVGAIGKQDAVNGSIVVDINSSQLTVEVNNENGFPEDQRTGTTISFVDGSRTFTIAPTGTKFHFYQLGEKFEKTSSESIIIDDVTGAHLIYYDNGVLSKIANPSLVQVYNVITQKCIVSYIYYNAISGTATIVQDERHGISMSPYTHLYLHQRFGAFYVSGLAINDFNIGNGSLDANAQFSTASGQIKDEDIAHDIDAVTSTTGLTYLYRSDSDGKWYKGTNAGFSFPVGATPLPQFNEYTGTTWQLTEVTSGDYVNIHIVADGSILGKPYAIVGTQEYTKISDASAGQADELSNLLGNLPLPEFVFLGSVIIEGKTSFTNSVNARVVQNDNSDDYTNWTLTSISSGVSLGDHNVLAGLELANTGVTWGHIDDQAQTIYGEKTMASDFSVNGNINIATGNDYLINGVSINTNGVLDNIAYLDSENPNFTGTGIFTFGGRILGEGGLSGYGDNAGGEDITCRLVNQNSDIGTITKIRLINSTNPTSNTGAEIVAERTDNTAAGSTDLILRTSYGVGNWRDVLTLKDTGNTIINGDAEVVGSGSGANMRVKDSDTGVQLSANRTLDTLNAHYLVSTDSGGGDLPICVRVNSTNMVLFNTDGTTDFNNNINVDGNVEIANDLSIGGDVLVVDTSTPQVIASAETKIQDNDLILGSDVSANTITNDNNKITRITMPHYTSDTVNDIALISGLSLSGGNFVNIGGGNNTAATRVRIYAGATNTVATGSSMFSVSTSEIVLNESSYDCDIRMESDTEANAFLLDGATGEVSFAKGIRVGSSGAVATGYAIDARDDIRIVGSDGDQIIDFNALDTTNIFRLQVTGTGHADDTIQIGRDDGGNDVYTPGNAGFGIDSPEGIIHSYSETSDSTPIYERFKSAQNGFISTARFKATTDLTIDTVDPNGFGVLQEFITKDANGENTIGYFGVMARGEVNSGYFRFIPVNAGTPGLSNSFVIDKTGNVGIGTDSPITITGVSNRLQLRSTVNPTISFYDGSEALNGKLCHITGNNQTFLFCKADDDGSNVAELARIQSTGELCVGTADLTGQLNVDAGTDVTTAKFTSDSTDAAIIRLENEDSSQEWSWGVAGSSNTHSGDGVMYFYDETGASVNFQLAPSGDLFLPRIDNTATGADLIYSTSSGEVFYQSSSKRYKENIKDSDNSDWIYDLKLKNYDRKKCKDGEIKNEDSFIAEEVDKIKSKAGIEGITFRNADGEIEGFNKTDMVPYIVDALQKQKEIIQHLLEENKKLNSEIAKLKKQKSKSEIDSKKVKELVDEQVLKTLQSMDLITVTEKKSIIKEKKKQDKNNKKEAMKRLKRLKKYQKEKGIKEKKAKKLQEKLDSLK